MTYKRKRASFGAIHQTKKDPRTRSGKPRAPPRFPRPRCFTASPAWERPPTSVNGDSILLGPWIIGPEIFISGLFQPFDLERERGIGGEEEGERDASIEGIPSVGWQDREDPAPPHASMARHRRWLRSRLRLELGAPPGSDPSRFHAFLDYSFFRWVLVSWCLRCLLVLVSWIFRWFTSWKPVALIRGGWKSSRKENLVLSKISFPFLP